MTDGVGSQVRVAADIGGTFTDVVLDSPVGRRTAKVLTTPRAPEAGVFEALEMVLEQVAVAPADVAVFVHGTTLATNALIERKGARTAFLTTRGFRDILEMGFEKRFEQYDVFMDKPEPLVPRPLRREVTERVSARGRGAGPPRRGASARDRRRVEGGGNRGGGDRPAPFLRPPRPRAGRPRGAVRGDARARPCACRAKSARRSASSSAFRRLAQTPTSVRSSPAISIGYRKAWSSSG